MKAKWLTFRAWLAWKIMPEFHREKIITMTKFQHIMITKLGLKIINTLCSDDCLVTSVDMEQEDEEVLH